MRYQKHWGRAEYIHIGNLPVTKATLSPYNPRNLPVPVDTQVWVHWFDFEAMLDWGTGWYWH